MDNDGPAEIQNLHNRVVESEGRPLFFLKPAFERGDRNLVGHYLRDLAKRLRNNPTPEECEAAAQVFDRIAAKGNPAWTALGFVAAHRPTTFRRDYDIWVAVRDLFLFHQVSRTQARARVASRYRISASRVKAIDLALERSWRTSCAEQGGLKSRP